MSSKGFQRATVAWKIVLPPCLTCGSGLFEPRCEKTGFWGFPTRSDSNLAVKPQKMASGFKFGFRKKRDCTIRVAKTKALISFAVTAKLICVFVFAYTKIRFSNDEAHLK